MTGMTAIGWTKIGGRQLLAAGIAMALSACAAGGPGIATQPTGALAVKGAGAASGDAASAAAEPRAERKATAKVALLLPLSGSGQTGLVADAMKRAAELALVDSGARHIQLMVRDDKGTPEGAEAAAREAAGAGAEIVLGPLFARSVSAAAPVARQANIPVVAFSNDRQVAGAGVHLLSFLATPEVLRVTAYAAAKGKRRFAALVPDDAFGRIVEAAFRESVARHGGEAVAVERYQPEANRMLEAVKKLRDSVRGLEEHGDAIDALFLPGGEETLATLLPQLKQAQFNFAAIKIIGTGALDYPNAGRDPLLVGAWFAAPDPRGWKEFTEKFASTYGIAPPRIATLAHDAITMIAALSSGPPGARFIPSQLARPSGFVGIDGAFRMMSDGTTERALAVLEVQSFAATVIEAAPANVGGGAQSTVLDATERRPNRLN